MEAKEQTEIDTNLYSRQIGTFGIETMGKLIKMNVVIIGQRGLGVEVAKNLILAGPRSVSLYDPETTKINDLGANFYLEEQHVGKVSRADAVLGKLQELNPYVKVDVIPDEKGLHAAISSGNVHVVCQTETIVNGSVLDQEIMDKECRQSKVGYISSQTFGPWGFAFLDFGPEHIVTDHDGEQTKSFIVTAIQKGEKTTVTVHEDKRHIFQEGDYVVLREVEGMTEINETEPIKIVGTTIHTFTLELDSTKFKDYTRQGLVENVKVPKKVEYHPWSQSYKNPAASTQFGMLEVPDLSKFGRCEQLHLALVGILEFITQHKRYPEDNDNDVKECLERAKAKQ